MKQVEINIHPNWQKKSNTNLTNPGLNNRVHILNKNNPIIESLDAKGKSSATNNSGNYQIIAQVDNLPWWIRIISNFHNL